MIQASRAGGLSAGGEPRILHLLPWLIALGLVIGIALTVCMMKAVVRRLARPPAASAPVMVCEQLKRRLLALNDRGVPYLVRHGPEADLVIEWKFADASWWGVLARAGPHKAYRLRLYFDERVHCAYALDEFGEVDWSAGLLSVPRVHFKLTFFRGVVLSRRERGFAYGFRTPTGGSPGKVLDYKFDIDMVKGPVIEVVTGSGWTFQPILWPRRRQRSAGKAI